MCSAEGLSFRLLSAPAVAVRIRFRGDNLESEKDGEKETEHARRDGDGVRKVSTILEHEKSLHHT